MEELSIRPAHMDDFEDILSLLKELWPNHALDSKTVKSIFSENIVNDLIYYFVAQKDSEIIGFVSISIINGLQQGRIAAIDEIVVSNKDRRQGVGKYMINHVDSFAKDKLCKSLELHTGLLRKNAHLFYEHLGFEKVSYYFSRKI